MKRALIVALVLVAGCSASYTVTMPFCPVSDSAKAAADSVPVACLFTKDTLVKR